MIQLEFVCRMRWTVFLLTSSVLACFTLTVADQYYAQSFAAPYTPQYALRRQGFDLFGDGGSLGIIGVGAIAAIIAGCVAVVQAANARTTIQNDINTLSTRANTLQTSAEAVTNTLMTAQADATTNNAEANAVCNFLSTVAMVTTMTGSTADNLAAINSILDAAMAVTCEP
ncbi:hypothetical protein TCAL_12393 [Tigriopus californicus]|uniref:Uncharacterized protein n=1 Tax=Tigriopus californicus TaxID=6832 RepID=A0A553P5Q7_TIGCA|nr:uncharacterized protein LOC131878005 [Tigriopus californicus]TRY73014.1 hypothetical protein TCAL_12393 [Tigriopus californicus]